MPPTEYAAGDGAPITDAADASPTVSFQMLHTTSITPSLTNPRKTFDAFKLKELTESIRSSGVHQPILVRPLPGTRTEDTLIDRGWGQPLPAYELICGERRLRACRMAGVELIPAMIRPLTDHQVLEIQLVENLQRDDLSPLEEAEGYERLVASTGIAKEDIGARIGRSRGYVYGRLKLLDLCQEGRQALTAGEIDASVGLYIARIPNEALQLKAIKEFTKEQWNGERLSARGCKEWIDRHVMIRLAQAPFDRDKANLVAAAGNCTQCSKRTGAAPDLFSDYDAPDLCTDRQCYDSKVTAHHSMAIDAARARGMTVIEGEAAAELMRSPHWIKDHAKVDDQADEDERTFRELLTREERKQIKLLVNPHTGEPMEIIPEEITDAVSERLSKARPMSRETRQSAKDREREMRAQDAFDLARRHALRWRQAALKDLLRLVLEERRVQAFSATVMRVLLLQVAGSGEIDLEPAIVGLRMSADEEIDELEWDECRERVTIIPDIELGPRLLATLMAKDATDVVEWANGARRLNEPAVLIDVAKSCGLDLRTYQDEATKALRIEYAALAKEEAQADDEGELQANEPNSRADMPVGTKVRFKQGLRAAGGKIRKVSGRDGTVESLVGDGALSVRFGPKAHETAIADWTELLVIEAPAQPQDLAKPTLKRKGKTTKADAQAGIAAELQALDGGKAKRAPATPLEALEQGAEAAA